MDPEIRSKIQQLQSKLNDLRKEGINDPFELETYIINNMTDFYDTYPSIVKRLCRDKDQDNSFLFKMIDSLEKVNNGENSLASTEMVLGEELAQKYLYPIVSKEDLAKLSSENSSK
jgi:hypothetical protein